MEWTLGGSAPPGVHLNTHTTQLSGGISQILGCGLPGRQRLCPGQEDAGRNDEDSQHPGLSGGDVGKEDGS